MFVLSQLRDWDYLYLNFRNSVNHNLLDIYSLLTFKADKFKHFFKNQNNTVN